MNILTFDIEEWFHILDFEETRTESDWKRYEVRIFQNVERLFRILDDTDTKATFFIIGWIAKMYPELVKMIASKYQIGTHTMNHQLVWQQSRKEFKEDVVSSVKLLEDITGKKVECFRAPGFSIGENDGWVFEILVNAGIKYDSSVFPAPHAHGGIPKFTKTYPSIIEYNGSKIKEFPVSYIKIANRHVMFSGGGYFRVMPYSLIKHWTKESDDYLLSYIHPRDLDAGQPMLKGLPVSRKFRSYVGLKGAEKKLRQWLTDFTFTDIDTANSYVDWNTPPIVMH